MHRHCQESATRHNFWDLDVIDRIERVVHNMAGKRLT